MNEKSISAVLAEIAERFSDDRLNVFDLSFEKEDAGRWLLSGEILDRASLEKSVQELAARFPEASFETGGVRILQQEPARYQAVGTNLAGFHRHPSRTRELLSQLLNGVVVEQLKEEGSWAFVRQPDGYLGWVQRAYLTSELPDSAAEHIVTAPVALLRAGPAPDGELVGRVFAGTAVRLDDVSSAWARINLVGSAGGWAAVDALSRLDELPQTAGERRRKMSEAVQDYAGVPYRWGGCTIYGIDCSGLVQLLHRLGGITLPRDADMQFAAGTPVEPPFQAGDLLYFGSEGSSRDITHVGMSLGGWEIVHSSGPRNGVYRDDVQAVDWLRDRFVGANSFI